MISKLLRLILPAGLVLLSILVVVALVRFAAGQRPERRPEGQKAVLVDTVSARAQSLNFSVRSQGTVRPRTRTTLVAEVSGKVISVSGNFIAGGFFRAGEVLLEIDPSDYRTAVKRAEAALASRRAQLADEEARSRQAVKDWKNLGRAGEPPPLVARQPQLADARANVLAAEADLEKARRDLQRTRIALPYDGLVRQRQVDLGQFVAPGTQLGVTFSVDTAEVRLPVTPTDLAYLDLPKPGSAPTDDAPIVQLAAEEAGETLTWEARLVRTEGVLDEQSRVLNVVAEVVDPYGVRGLSRQPVLRVGTFVRAAIEGRYARDLVVLPRFVLRNDNTVLVANAERELEVRPVTVARAEPDLVYISSGIEDGEQVITTTLDAPIPGTRLVLAEQESRSGEAAVAARPGSTGDETKAPITEPQPAAGKDGI